LHISKTISVSSAPATRATITECEGQKIPKRFRNQTNHAHLLIWLIPADIEHFLAVPCELDPLNNRPIVGFIKFNPDVVDQQSEFMSNIFGEFIREIFFVMGFSQNLFRFF
jgi:hypothetical protein